MAFNIYNSRVIIEDNGLVHVSTPNYETLLLADNDIVNKKYVDDAVALENLWDRDLLNGYLYPHTLTDKVGIGKIPIATDEILSVNGGITLENGESIINSNDGIVSIKNSSNNKLFTIDFASDVSHLTLSTDVGNGIRLPISEIIQESTGVVASYHYSYSNSALGNALAFYKSRGTTIGSYVQTQDNDRLFFHEIRGVGSNNDAFRFAASIEVFQDGASGTTFVPSEMIFKTASSSGTNANQLFLDSTGYVGISGAPLCRLHVQNDGMIISQGAYGSGLTLPISGTGVKMFWYPRKGAFRAGRAFDTEWDDANIGDYSAAFGYRTTASGIYSFAIGYLSVASGGNSFAAGMTATASNSACFAAGRETTANGLNSFAAGQGTRASGSYSFAVGLDTVVTGSGSFATGRETTVSGLYSFASGQNTTASGSRTFVTGYNSTAQSFCSIVGGQFNIISGTINSWIDTEPLFVLGNGTDDLNRNNAFVVYKNGNAELDGNLTIAGDLTVNGTTTSIDTVNLEVEDNIVILSKNQTGSPTLDSGIEIERGDEINAQLLWNEATDKWQAGIAGSLVDIALASDISWTRDSINGYLYPSTLADRIGINTNTPEKTLDVNGQFIFRPTGSGILKWSTGAPEQPDQGLSMMGYNAEMGSSQGSMSLINSRGNLATPSTSLSGDKIGEIRFGAYSGGVIPYQYGVKISAFASENWNGSSYGSEIRFYTVNNGSSSATQKVVIDNSGNVGIGTNIASEKLDVVGNIEQNSLKRQASSESLADDASIALPTGVSGKGWVQAGDDEEYTDFRFKTDGTITIFNSTGNVVNTDTDGRLCVFNNAGTVTIRNRLGSSKTIKYIINFS